MAQFSQKYKKQTKTKRETTLQEGFLLIKFFSFCSNFKKLLTIDNSERTTFELPQLWYDFTTRAATEASKADSNVSILRKHFYLL